MMPDRVGKVGVGVDGPVVAGPSIDGRPPVIAEAHWPFRPANWNGVLVLGEAQNLATSAGTPAQVRAYSLEAQGLGSPDERAGRLTSLPAFMPAGWSGQTIHVKPWHSGPLRMAVACHGHDPDRCAVTNAVPWAWTKGGKDDNTMLGRKAVVEAAAAFLTTLFPRQPRTVYACGGRAQAVTAAAGWDVARWRQGSYRSLWHDRRAWRGAFTVEAILAALPAEVRRTFRERQAREAAGGMKGAMKPEWVALFVAQTLGVISGP
ncbi:MAG: hypothetical protein H6706_31005 [Myxococcales bacterium]|nr:hypothetical protein [Myxococcales bacterium]